LDGVAESAFALRRGGVLGEPGGLVLEAEVPADLRGVDAAALLRHGEGGVLVLGGAVLASLGVLGESGALVHAVAVLATLLVVGVLGESGALVYAAAVLATRLDVTLEAEDDPDVAGAGATALRLLVRASTADIGSSSDKAAYLLATEMLAIVEQKAERSDGEFRVIKTGFCWHFVLFHRARP
jgi:hypothetical protein